MKHWLLIHAGLLIGFWGLPSFANIYVWTDENGAKHFTNDSPPDKASIFMLEPKIASIAASVAQASETGRLQEAEKKDVQIYCDGFVTTGVIYQRSR